VNIIFDLDGTLIDSRKRLFELFCNLTQQKILEFNDYWELKRSMYDHSYILKNYLNYSDQDISSFNNKFLSLIEEFDYLDKDELFPYTIPVLETLHLTDVKMFILTARQNQKNAIQEINKFRLEKYFADIFITENANTKKHMIEKSSLILSKSDCIVGDTGFDIQTGKSLGIITIAVLSGFRNASMLKKYSPDYILNNISELYHIL